ncbi:MAG: PIG-L family deacetylase, partial [Bacteroidetes bacterium]|nr:PIG-L family deacetylase [Bacteroidota bacterium]
MQSTCCISASWPLRRLCSGGFSPANRNRRHKSRLRRRPDTEELLRRQTIHALVALCLLAAPAPVRTQQALPRTSSEIKLALDHLPVLGSVLYVAAHPDDENTAFLAAMARGRGLRTAYLSMTRGEGGQNLIGPEQGAALGVIRTQELLAARRIDGAEQYFTRAIDFGYSKTTEETLRFWGHDSTLADVVWVIRTFRPDVIVTRFTSELGGHGNHTASALLAIEAFDAAADPHRFPEQLRFTEPWRAKRLVWNMFRGPQADTLSGRGIVRLDLGEFSPLLGRSFAELAGEGRSMHKSQGFGAPQNRGEVLNYFQHLRGDTAFTDLFEGLTLTWGRVNGGDAVERAIAGARASFAFDNPSTCLPDLFRISSMLA